MKFNSQVTKVRYSGSNWILGFSKDEHVGVYNTENQKSFTCTPGHTGCTALGAAVDPNGKFIATSGSDGYLNIYKIDESGSSASFLSKVKICEKKVVADRTFDLDMHWIDGETVVVPGAS